MKTIQQNEKYYKIFKMLPIIILVVTLFAGFIFGIIDSNTSGRYSYSTRYGTFRTHTAFGCFILWQLIFGASATIMYFATKISCCIVILQTEYLKKIAESLADMPVVELEEEKPAKAETKTTTETSQPSKPTNL